MVAWGLYGLYRVGGLGRWVYGRRVHGLVGEVGWGG